MLFVPSQRVACEDDPDLFFIDTTAAKAEAAAICADCPFRTECEAAGQDEEYGVWGGKPGGAAEAPSKRAERAERDALILTMHDEGWSSSAIAGFIGLTYAGVRHVIARERGVSYRVDRATEAQKERRRQVLALHEQGMSRRQIARQIGATEGAVASDLRSLFRANESAA